MELAGLRAWRRSASACQRPTPIEAQATDRISLVALTIAKAKGEATGTAIRDNVRKITKGDGDQGLHARSRGWQRWPQGKEINYEGASGPCDFTDIGDILDCKFRFNQVESGKFKFVKMI